LFFFILLKKLTKKKSSEMRVGMQELDNIRIEAPSMMLNNFISFPTNMSSFQTTTPNSPYLILHVHGGGEFN
jgi:hypothetical protein